MHCTQKLIGGLILALTATSAAAVTVYECEDDKGQRTFESTCPPGTNEVKQKDYNAGSGSAAAETTGDLPAVIVYLVPDAECETCVQTKDFLTAKNIPFTTRDVKADFALQEELKKRSGELRAPTVMVGDKAIVGFNRAGLTSVLQETGHIPAEEPAAEGTTTEPGGGPATPETGTESPAPAP